MRESILDISPRPIVILTVPRSGSSMTARIFHEHGVFCGDTKPGDQNNPNGYFENKQYISRVQRFIKQVTYPKIDAKNIGWKEEVEDILRHDGYDEKKRPPYLFKHSARYFPLWNDMEPRFVCTIRKKESIQKSWKRINEQRRTLISIRKDFEAMDYIDKHVPHVKVYTDEVVQGDYSSLKKAMNYCGLIYSDKITDDIVDPSLWHHK